MKGSTFVLLVILLAAGAGVYWVLRDTTAPEPVVQAPVETPQTQAPAEPVIKNPLPEPAAPAATAKTEQTPPPEPLPALDDSDATVGQSIGELIEPVPVTDVFQLKNLVRYLVVTADNLPGKKLPQKYRPFSKVPGEFKVKEQSLVTYTLDPANDDRYAPFIKVIDALDIDRTVAVYVRLYPLFQQAYEDLGYPDQYFNDRLVEVIDHLLQAPKVKGPIQLVQHSVFYKFADPALENLSAGQKVMLRMGPQNRAIVENKLRAMRQVLASQSH
jgi:hypothetical protein